jgi:hypothetical protein
MANASSALEHVVRIVVKHKTWPNQLSTLQKSLSQIKMTVLSKKLMDRGKVIDEGKGENGK